MRKFLWLGALPAALSAIAIVVVAGLGLFSGPVPSPANLLLAANLVFITGTNVGVAILSAKSYLKSGSSTVLVLGCAVLVSGLSALSAGLAAESSANGNVTIFNIGILVASGLQVLAAFLATVGEVSTGSGRRIVLVSSYSVGVAFVLLLSAMSLDGLFPVFFASTGPTLLRQAIVTSAVGLFALASSLFVLAYFRTKSAVLFWYSLAVITILVSLFGSLYVTQFTGVLSWLTRLGQYVGGIYYLAAMMSLRGAAEQVPGVSDTWAEAFVSDRRQLAALFSNMREGVAYHRVLVDDFKKPFDLIFLEVNPAYERIAGRKRADLVGRKITEVAPGIEKDPVDWIGIFGCVALTGESAQFENYSQVLNRWYSVSAFSPRKGYVVVLTRDITSRKKSEREIADLAKFPAENPNAVMRIDNKGVIIYCNRGGQILLKGWTTQVGRPLPEHVVSRVIESLASGEKVEFEENCEGRTFLFTLAPVLGEGYVNIYGVDISERKELQNRLEDYTKNLERLVEERTRQLKDAERLAAIGATAGMVGHDIRNPLQAMIGDAYLAALDLNSIPKSAETASIREHLAGIERSAEYVDKIVSDLQDYARPLNPVAQEIDLELLCNELLRKIEKPKNIKVSCSVEKEAKNIIADPSFLQRIMSNLVNNAVQAMPEGGRLEIRVYREGRDTIIVVQDTGVGIPENVRPKLFGPLFTTKAKGQGFGLAVVKRMTEAMNGTVAFESEVGKGTRFIIRLPSLKRDNQ